MRRKWQDHVKWYTVKAEEVSRWIAVSSTVTGDEQLNLVVEMVEYVTAS